MKLIFVLPSLKVSGSSILFELADRLSERNHDVRVTSLDELTDPIYPLKIIPQKLQDSLKFFKEADTIIAYRPVCAFYINDLDTQARKFYFITDDVKKFYTRRSIKEKFPKLDANKVNIEQQAQQLYIEASYNLQLTYLVTNNDLEDMLKEHKRKVKVIPIGVNTKLFYPDIGVPKADVPRILVEGDRLAWKGVDEVNQALADLRGFQLWTLSSSPPVIKSTKHWRSPDVEDTRKILSSCDILVRARHEDGAAELQAQAMACGCAVLTRKTSGSGMFCEHEKNSWVFEAENRKKSVKAIKKGLEKLIKEPELRKSLVREGLKSVKKLDWEPSVDILEKRLKRR